MLVKLLPDQISSNWDLIKFALEECAPNITARGLNVVLENLLSDEMQCWWEVVETEEKVVKLYAVLLTSIHYDRFFQATCLRLCAFYGYEELTQLQWQEGYETFVNFAKGRDCSRIEAFTERAGLAEIGKKFGFNVQYHVSREV